MSDKLPKESWVWPPVASVSEVRRVGAKCLVSLCSDKYGGWLEAGGVITEKGGTDATSEAGDEYPTGVCVDPAQARVYYRCCGKDTSPDVRVILPDDAPFRAARKGMIPGRSKSFDVNGNPVPQVRLLYAIKTGLYDARKRAVEDFEHEFTGHQTHGEMFNAMAEVARDNSIFQTFAGEFMAKSAADPKGLADWALWEKVADDAASFTQTRMKIASGERNLDNNGSFIQAVKETMVEHRGLPAQKHVREKWKNLGGIGNWTEIRKTLGFDWLPPYADWSKAWKEA